MLVRPDIFNIDICKAIVSVWFLAWFVARYGTIVTGTDRVLIICGMSLFLFSGLLDYADGIAALNRVPVFGADAPFHDLLEDQVGDTLGYVCVVAGALRHIGKH